MAISDKTPNCGSCPSAAAGQRLFGGDGRELHGQRWQPAAATDWHQIVVYGKLAEICAKYLGKGRQVYVEGRLRTREFEDKSGGKRQRTEIIAQRVQFLGAKPELPAGGEAEEPAATEECPF